MLLYLFLTLQLLAVVESLAHAHKQIIRAILFVTLLLVIGMRDNVGGDWNSYVHLFNSIQNGIYPKIEIGYLALNKWLPNIYWVNFVSAWIALSLLYGAMSNIRVKNYSLFISCTYLPFILLFSGFTRQSVSVCAFAFFWSSIWSHKKIKTLPIILGTAFHLSAIIPFFISTFSYMSKGLKILAISISTMVLFSNGDIVLPKVWGYLVNNTYHSSGAPLRLAFLILPCARFFAQKKISYSLAIITLVILLPFFSTLVDRFSFYLIFSLPMLLYTGTPRDNFLFACGANSLSVLCFLVWYSYSWYAVEAWHHYTLIW